MDWDFFKRMAKQPDANAQQLEFLRTAVSPFVPVEVVCPPVAIDQLRALDPMVTALHEAGARGTDDSLIAAFGVHINPELPDLGKESIEYYLKAFALLQWWLVKTHEVDLSRRLTPYIDLYPDAYLKNLLSSDYASLDALIDDYLKFNNTRNRALDMLPLFKELREEKVSAAVDDHLVNARPTFHYRLPNCLIGRSGWNLSEAWNIWCVVEELAQRKQDVDYLADKFISAWRPLLGVDQAYWLESISQWLQESELV